MVIVVVLPLAQRTVPASRLTHRYYRRWWYWKGISQARLHRLHGQTELGLDLSTVRRVGGIPAFIIRAGITDGLAARAWRAAVDREMWMWYSVGYAVESVWPRN